MKLTLLLGSILALKKMLVLSFLGDFLLPTQTYFSSTLAIKPCVFHPYRHGGSHILFHTIFPKHLTHSSFLSRKEFLVFIKNILFYLIAASDLIILFSVPDFPKI